MFDRNGRIPLLLAGYLALISVIKTMLNLMYVSFYFDHFRLKFDIVGLQCVLSSYNMSIFNVADTEKGCVLYFFLLDWACS